MHTGKTVKRTSHQTSGGTRAHLDIGAGLVRHLHDELAALAVGLADQLLQDMQVDRGTQVVDVGHEDVLLTLSNELVQQARVVEAGVDVPMTRGVPHLSTLPRKAQLRGDREEGLFIYTRVPNRGGGTKDK